MTLTSWTGSLDGPERLSAPASASSRLSRLPSSVFRLRTPAAGSSSARAHPHALSGHLEPGALAVERGDRPLDAAAADPGAAADLQRAGALLLLAPRLDEGRLVRDRVLRVGEQLSGGGLRAPGRVRRIAASSSSTRRASSRRAFSKPASPSSRSFARARATSSFSRGEPLRLLRDAGPLLGELRLGAPQPFERRLGLGLLLVAPPPGLAEELEGAVEHGRREGPAPSRRKARGCGRRVPGGGDSWAGPSPRRTPSRRTRRRAATPRRS